MSLDVINHLIGIDINAPPKLQKHKDKKRFEQFIPNKRNALLVLPRYDHSISRSVVDIVDLNNFEVQLDQEGAPQHRIQLYFYPL